MGAHSDTAVEPCQMRKTKRLKVDPKAFLQGTCLVLIETAGFAASTLLIILGLPLFTLLFLAGWDLGLLFAQLGNLADHYASAEPLARLAFSRDLQFTFVAVAGGFTLLRLPIFIKRLGGKLDRELPHE